MWRMWLATVWTLILSRVALSCASLRVCFALFAVIIRCDLSGEAIIQVKYGVGTVEDAGTVVFAAWRQGGKENFDITFAPTAGVRR